MSKAGRNQKKQCRQVDGDDGHEVFDDDTGGCDRHHVIYIELTTRVHLGSTYGVESADVGNQHAPRLVSNIRPPTKKDLSIGTDWM